MKDVDLSKWVVSKVKRFDGMFPALKYFNSDLSKWDSTSDFFFIFIYALA